MFVAVALATVKTSCTMDKHFNDWFENKNLWRCVFDFYHNHIDAEDMKGSPLTVAEACP